MNKFVLTKREIAAAYKAWCEGAEQGQIADALHVCKRTIQRSFAGKKRIRPTLIYNRNTNQTEYVYDQSKCQHIFKISYARPNNIKRCLICNYWEFTNEQPDPEVEYE